MQDVKIVFFPHAGGNAERYNCFSNILTQMGYKSIVVEYSGHGTRIQEKLISDMKELVNNLYNDLFAGENDENYVFFGHSMGSWVAYELCRKFEEEGKKPPILLFVSGNIPPLFAKNMEVYGKMSDDELIDNTLEFGGTPPEVFEIKELRDVFLSVLRNDYLLLEKYALAEELNEFKVRSDIIAMSGQKDKCVGDKLDLWKTCTRKELNTYYFSGKHFYLFDYAKKISDIISEQIKLHMSFVSR